jgi:hypothetical protein
MCGRYNVTDSSEVRILMEQLSLSGTSFRAQHDVSPGALVSSWLKRPVIGICF